MNRWASKDPDDPASDEMRRVYQKTLANWAFDILSTQPRVQWREADPAEDYLTNDWASLYSGSVLDD